MPFHLGLQFFLFNFFSFSFWHYLLEWVKLTPGLSDGSWDFAVWDWTLCLMGLLYGEWEVPLCRLSEERSMAGSPALCLVGIQHELCLAFLGWKSLRCLDPGCDVFGSDSIYTFHVYPIFLRLSIFMAHGRLPILFSELSWCHSLRNTFLAHHGNSQGEPGVLVVRADF